MKNLDEQNSELTDQGRRKSQYENSAKTVFYASLFLLAFLIVTLLVGQ